MFCKNCGQMLDENSNFCKNCGRKIEKKVENINNEEHSYNIENNDTIKKELQINIFDCIWYIGISILLFKLVFDWIGIPFDNIGTIIYIIAVAIDGLGSIFASKGIENKFIRYILLPIILPIFVLGIMGDISRKDIEDRNEFNRPYVEAKRQALINDAYNKRFKK